MTLLLAKRNQYRDILAELEVLDSGGEASRVQNCNKRDAQALIDIIVGEDTSVRSIGAPAAWKGLENVGFSAQGSQNPSVISKDEAIVQLGHLFYLAGSQITSVLETSMEALLSVMRSPSSSDYRKVLTVKALGEVCWCSGESKQRLYAQGGVQTLLDCVSNFVAVPQLAQWACHTLTVAVSDSAEVWQVLQRALSTLQPTLTAIANDENLWTDWDNNHAAILLGLLKGPIERQ